ncbi:MAG: Xaa-Pro peptidase family protein [Gammaproteobacteria bacterium]|nr:Xaa-Pro peptidase family protein [Gammaproteobacteria bacterium]
MSALPRRGFPETEFEQRTADTQRAMHRAGLDAVLLSTEPDVRYYSGFLSQFWASPTRPWFLIIPLAGKPIAVVPEIGAAGMAGTWLDDVRTWSSPDPVDDGVSLLISTLNGLPVRHGCIGVPMGPESHLRMPLADFMKIRVNLERREIVDARDLLRRIRTVKSENEIEKVRAACGIASTAFEALPGKFRPGMTERDICRGFKIDLIAGGADSAPYVMGASGPGSYNDIIMGPRDRVLSHGDVLIIDTGATFDGYFCDFDRNYGFGSVSDRARRAYETVYLATDAGFRAARPGATTTDLWRAMWRVLEAGGALGNDVGRMGHGLGMELTEWPSNMPGDDTPMEAGMVMTLEPGMVFEPGQWMIHEENIVIREEGAEWLSRRAWPEMPLVGDTPGNRAS